MLDHQRVAGRSEDSREVLFMERYEQLLSWALRLTNQQRAGAEDLVQEAFIQFTRGRTSLDAIANIDGYLRRMLRYMHLAGISRNTQQLSDRSMSISDYDSFNLGWRSIEIQRRMQAQQELRRICNYACIRKETSRAGGVLILRFFHEYFPSEIARILCRSRHCVDEWQRLARNEVKVYLDDPSRLKFAGSKQLANTFRTRVCCTDGDLITELRQMIFTSRQGDCLSHEQLREIYEFGFAEKLTTARFGHIVSCSACLDDANGILGLPLLAERYQTESNDKTSPPNNDASGDDGSGGSSAGLKLKFEERLREVIEHQPKELRILINGSEVSSLKVSSNDCELDIRLDDEKKVRFVEVVSEQDLRLFFSTFLHRAEPDNEQWAQIELSEQRTLGASLRRNALRIIYKSTACEPASEALKLVAGVAVQSVGDQTSAAAAVEPVTISSNWLTRLARYLQSRIHKSVLMISGHGENGRTDVLALATGSQTYSKPLWTRPEFVTTLISIVLIGVVLLLKIDTAPLDAITLLDRAAITEQTREGLSDQVVHRVINLEERRSVEGALMSRRKIETWDDRSTEERAVRIYDDNGRLIAGRLQRKNGTSVVYNHQLSQPPLDRTNTGQMLLSAEEIYQLEPTAKNFTTLAGSTRIMRIDERPASYVISSSDERMIGNARLLKATITLRRHDLHATEQTLLIERDGEVREYRFVELSFNRLSRKDLEPTIFEPEAATKVNSLAPLNPTPGEPKPKIASHAEASEELEVEVAYLLNNAKGNLSEQVSLRRESNGSLRVEGVVDTQARKDELLRALASVGNNPFVTIDITTLTDLRRPTGGNLTWSKAQNETNTTDLIAVDGELREYLARTHQLVGGAQLDEEVRAFSSLTVNRAYRALFRAIELKQIVERFSDVDMRSVSPDARAKWLAMIRNHASALQREYAALRNDVQPIFMATNTPIELREDREFDNDGELTHAVQELHKLTLANSDGLRAAFMISSQSSGVAIKSSQFWRAFSDAQQLAGRIVRYTN